MAEENLYREKPWLMSGWKVCTSSLDEADTESQSQQSEETPACCAAAPAPVSGLRKFFSKLFGC